jgi:hypothetical protein
MLYGQEINPETYAICKADMLIKGEGEQAEHIIAFGSTLAQDAYPADSFRLHAGESALRQKLEDGSRPAWAATRRRLSTRASPSTTAAIQRTAW